MPPKDAGGMANSEDLDQTAPVGKVLFPSVPFTQAHLSKNLFLVFLDGKMF